MAITADRMIVFVSQGFGARYHDSRTLRQCAHSFMQVVSINDTVTVDLGFVGAWKKAPLNTMTFHHPHKRSKEKSLTREQ